MPPALEIRDGLLRTHADVLTPGALGALEALAPLDDQRRELMAARIRRRAERAREQRPIAFLDPAAPIPGTSLLVRDARAGQFAGSDIPSDLQRQWIQGTGPATKPRASLEAGLRSAAYALLSGADGWMFDGEDALGQTDSMSLDNQRNLRLAFAGDRAFLGVAEQVAGDMNAWAQGFFGRPIIDDWRRQLGFTTRIYRPRGLHLDDRHVRWRDGTGFSASIVDLVLFVVASQATLRAEGRSIVLYLPKIQTAEEAALWRGILEELEAHLGLWAGTIRTYVLVEQLEAAFQLMEIRAVLGPRFVGFNTGRWDYINSVADARRWDPDFINPNIEAIGMTYAYMRAYEDRVRRAVNTPDRDGRFALWQGGMEAQIPVGSTRGVETAMRTAIAGAEREQREGASGKWVAHWKMVHIVRPVWERVGEDNQMGRAFPPLTHTPADADALVALEPAPRTVRGARDLLSVAIQYGNAFLRGHQAAALKPADFFADDDVLYLMEDMATGEIRLSILWEWLHKGAAFTEDDGGTGVRAGDVMTAELFDSLLDGEYAKLQGADDRNVHDDSKATTLPVARTIVEAYVASALKPPWYVDLLNANLGNHDLDGAHPYRPVSRRVRGRRIAGNPQPRLSTKQAPDVTEIRIGANFWNQWTEWPALLEAGIRADRLGYDTLWTWDHLYPIVGDSRGPNYEGWLTIAAWAARTERIRMGLMVGANPYREPTLVAKMATTLDHISGGRAILGIGAAWNEEEARDFGFEFGSGPPERLRWLAEALPIMRGMLDGTEPTAAGPRYRATHVRNLPLPVQEHLPIFIGGGGEKVTLRLVAQHADMNNLGGGFKRVRHKEAILRQHCEAVGRDPAEIERTASVGAIFIRDDRAEAERTARLAFETNRAKPWNPHAGTPEDIAEELAQYLEIGYRHLIANFPAPYDEESVTRFATDVRNLLQA